jgi:outer membrane protein TolC
MALAQGQIQLVVNTVTLYKALGGGWEVAEPSPATQPVAISLDKGKAP